MKLPNIYTMVNSNFGDGVNKTFWEYIIQGNINNNRGNIHYITTGSIMCLVNNKSIIFGTGFISKDGDIGGGNWISKSNKKYKIPYDIIAVRGPLTRKKLLDFNIKCPEKYGDPLILMPCIYDIRINIEDNIVGIIPHYIDKNNNNYNLLITNLRNSGYIVKFIDIQVGNNYKKIIDNINNCKYIISSSLHAIMMGIIYKKKTIFVEFSNKVIGDGFKFQDFFHSVNINYKNINTYNVDIMNNIIDVDYEYLQKIGKNLISLIPFINIERKIFLTKKFEEFYNIEPI